MSAGLPVTLDGLAAEIGAVGERARALSWERPVKRSLQLVRSKTKECFAGGHTPDGDSWLPLRFPRPQGGDKPLRNFGLLMASATTSGAEGNITEVRPDGFTFGTNHEGAATHQWGAVVRARSARHLTLPLTKEAARAGRARDMDGLFVLRSKRGNLFLARTEQKGRGKRKRPTLVLHFLLKEEVTIPAREFLGVTADVRETMAGYAADEAARQLGGDHA